MTSSNLYIVIMVMINAQSFRFQTGMKKDRDLSVLVLKPFDRVALFDPPTSTGEARIYKHTAQRRGDDGYLRYSKYVKTEFTGGVLAVIYNGRGIGTCYYYVPYFEASSIDTGRLAHSCRFSKFSAQGFGSYDNIRKCSPNLYRSGGRIIGRRKCKREDSIQTIPFRSNGCSFFPYTSPGTTTGTC